MTDWKPEPGKPAVISAEDAAVLTAAEAWAAPYTDRDRSWLSGLQWELVKAVRARRTAQSAPPKAEPPAAEALRFKVGDRVRVTRRPHALTGWEGTVTIVRLGRPSCVVDFGQPLPCGTSPDRTTWEFYPDGLELATPAAITPSAAPGAAREEAFKAAWGPEHEQHAKIALAKERVVDAAMRWNMIASDTSKGDEMEAQVEILRATDALGALLAPPVPADPVAELREAFDALDKALPSAPGPLMDRLRAALAAMEART